MRGFQTMAARARELAAFYRTAIYGTPTEATRMLRLLTPTNVLSARTWSPALRFKTCRAPSAADTTASSGLFRGDPL